jgi:hypothetical protein
LLDDDDYRCHQGVLSFVEPDARGNVKEETFTVTEEEVRTLHDTIIESTAKIISGEFLTYPCDDKVSDYCHLAKLLTQAR